MRTKKCTGPCQRELLLSLSGFYKKQSAKDGLTSRCRECTKLSGKNYREKNKDKIAQRNQKYYRENYNKCNQQNKKYHSTIEGHLRRVFNDMNRRCNVPNCKSFKYYGGRGIENKFRSLEEFVDCVVKTLEVDPRGLQIDRINNNGNYEKGNIRFVTSKVNIHNRRNTIKRETSQ